MNRLIIYNNILPSRPGPGCDTSTSSWHYSCHLLPLASCPDTLTVVAVVNLAVVSVVVLAVVAILSVADVVTLAVVIVVVVVVVFPVAPPCPLQYWYQLTRLVKFIHGVEDMINLSNQFSYSDPLHHLPACGIIFEDMCDLHLELNTIFIATMDLIDVFSEDTLFSPLVSGLFDL